MTVIPAIDLLNGKVVRLHKGNYKQATVYNDDPVEEAWKFKNAGFAHIHVVDLNGAREGEFINLRQIRNIIEETGLSVQYGGGIRTYEDAEMLFKQGLAKVICSSMAVRNREDWLKVLGTFGDRAILGMDLKDGKVAYAGWKETVEDSLDTFLEPMLDRGLKEVLCTDISRDGTMEGPNIELYKNLMEQFPGITFIASGGVGNYDDLVSLKEAGVEAVIVGRAYYEGKLSLEEMAGLMSR